jgi:N-acetylneuraminic acid mutarotase
MPTPRWQLGVATASNGKIYAIGGGNASFLGTNEEYDPTANTWTTRASMPTPRTALGVVAASNGKIYAIGGYNGSFVGTNEEYDPANDTWTTRASMPTARYNFGIAITTGGDIYVVGGSQTTNNVPLATVEVYHPGTDTWTTVASLPSGRTALGATVDSHGMIYAIGGLVGPVNRRRIVARVQVYNPASNTWLTLARMPTARYNLGVAAIGNQIYAIGGFNYAFLGTNERGTVP